MATHLNLTLVLNKELVNRYNKREYIDLGLPSLCFGNG
jgi:hypothetical protein